MLKTKKELQEKTKIYSKELLESLYFGFYTKTNYIEDRLGAAGAEGPQNATLLNQGAICIFCYGGSWSSPGRWLRTILWLLLRRQVFRALPLFLRGSIR